MRLLGFRRPRPVTDWTATTYGVPSNPEETTTMITPTEAPPDTSPEVAEALRRLEQIDPGLVSDALGEAVLRGARVAAFAREALRRVGDLRADLVAAVANRDAREAAEFAADLAAQEKVLEVMPTAEDIAPAAESCLALAREKLDAAAGQIQEAPTLSASAERSAYRSLPVNLVTDIEAPLVTRADRQLQADIEAWSGRRRSLLDGFNWWHRSATTGANGALELLAAVGSLVATAESVTADGLALSAAVTAANIARRDAGDDWQQRGPNPTLNAQETQEIRALRRHRERIPAAQS